LTVRVLLGVALTLLVLWVAFIVALVVVRPRGMNLREARRAVPDTVRLLRDLRVDRELPAGVRRWLAVLIVYVALPIDVIPDFVPVVGYADDVIVVALVLRRVVRLAGPAALERHWHGTPVGLNAIRHLAGLADSAS
jgi:uncharacterized membrane protein YkvA (DUF1232 family)